MSQRLMPLFPLPETVVFPGLLIPLYIFEERYKQITKDLLAMPEDERRFVITLASQDGYRAIGGYVRLLMASENPDGTFNIVCRGEDRCYVDEVRVDKKLYQELPDRPFPTTRTSPAEEAVAAWDALDVFRAFIADRADPKALEDAISNLPEDPLYQSSFLCVNIGLEAEDRQALLEAPTLVDRLVLAQTLMRQGSFSNNTAEA